VIERDNPAKGSMRDNCSRQVRVLSCGAFLSPACIAEIVLLHAIPRDNARVTIRVSLVCRELFLLRVTYSTGAFEMSNAETPVVTKLSNIREVADQTGLCEKSVWNATAPRGDLPCVKLGTRVLYRPEDVTAWIESRVVRAATVE
jgi:predicted DNA-binding transcriptional regulator AlpA